MRNKIFIAVSCALLAVLVILPVSCGGGTKYSIATNVQGSGKVTGGGSYESGKSVQLVATPAAGSHFVDWTGGATGTTPTITVSVISDLTVTANFSDKYTVTITTSGTGTGTVSGAGEYTLGQTAHLVASPADKTDFGGWTGGASSTALSTDITVNSDVTVDANFTEWLYPDIGRVTAEQVREWLNMGVVDTLQGINVREVLVVDVRDGGSYEGGHIPQATNVAYNPAASNEDNIGAAQGMAGSISYYKYFVVLCDCADESSSGAFAEFMLQASSGFTTGPNGNLVLLKTGMQAWRDAGFKQSTGPTIVTSDYDQIPATPVITSTDTTTTSTP